MKYLLLTLALFSFNVFAQEIWYKYAESDSYFYFAKIESYKSTKDGGQFIQKIEQKTKPVLTFYLIEMKTKDCNKGYGFVYVNSLDGKLVSQFDYVEGGETIAQKAGDALCELIKSSKSI